MSRVSELSGWSEINQQLADAVRVPRTTLQSAVARGEIPTITAGTQRETVLVSVAAVRRWARNRKAAK